MTKADEEKLARKAERLLVPVQRCVCTHAKRNHVKGWGECVWFIKVDDGLTEQVCPCPAYVGDGA